ncbi:hypothetical protein [Rossellomorea vietnamensis]|uniref:hypothetical protein n=1 Tax=Rossellomorea vietnamensis TaxID=218284 RepID=UPI0020790B1C|nr:hypothetical protein [Rossellomorea vietnamensis]
MKIVIVSDTHMPGKGRGLPPILQKDLMESDLIIHGGISGPMMYIWNSWGTGN